MSCPACNGPVENPRSTYCSRKCYFAMKPRTDKVRADYTRAYRERHASELELIVDTLPIDEADVARFWAFVDVRGPDECWPWTGGCTDAGYGKFSLRSVSVIASRIALKIRDGEMPKDKRACHHCDNPPCCNPRHLFPGTDGENQKDSYRKGRQSQVGERNAFAKVTDAQASEIRRRALAGENQRKLAKEFGVTQPNVSCIKRGVSRCAS